VRFGEVAPVYKLDVFSVVRLWQRWAVSCHFYVRKHISIKKLPLNRILRIRVSVCTRDWAINYNPASYAFLLPPYNNAITLKDSLILVQNCYVKKFVLKQRQFYHLPCEENRNGPTAFKHKLRTDGVKDRPKSIYDSEIVIPLMVKIVIAVAVFIIRSNNGFPDMKWTVSHFKVPQFDSVTFPRFYVIPLHHECYLGPY
jgi:hypothetical protein